MERNHRTPAPGSVSRQSGGSGRSSSWLGTSVGSGSRLMRDLDEDQVDREILDEEIQYRQEHESTCRRNILRILDSNPMQVLLYVLVVLDAGVVIAEILLDLHAMRSQYREATADLLEAMNFLKNVYAQDLEGYDGDNIHYILHTLRNKHLQDRANRSSSAYPTAPDLADLWQMAALPHPDAAEGQQASASHRSHHTRRQSAALATNDSLRRRPLRGAAADAADASRWDDVEERRLDEDSAGLLRVLMRSGRKTSDERDSGHTIDAGVINIYAMQRTTLTPGGSATDSDELKRSPGHPLRRDRGSAPSAEEEWNRTKRAGRKIRSIQSEDEEDEEDSAKDSNRIVTVTSSKDSSSSSSSSSASLSRNHSFIGIYPNTTDTYYRKYSYADSLLKIAHILHYIGIGILGFFVVQVFLKVYGMSCEFFRKKLELFDAVIVLTSFSLDLVFVEGITGAQSEEAIALLIIFLLWRILRIINGIMVTSKKRQDLRIQLQKRARRRADKKIEYLEDDRSWKEREIHNLRDLCTERGATEEEISRCKPRRRTILQKMDTSMGLSSIATLSLGLSMSMAGAGRAVIRTLGTVPGSFEGRQSLQQLFPVLPLGVPLPTKGGGGGSTRRLSPGFVNSLQSSKWRSRLHPSKRTRSVPAGDDRKTSRGQSVDHTPSEGRRDTTSTTTIASGKSSSIDIPPLDGRSDSTIHSRINANSEENQQLASTPKQSVVYNYRPVLIPDVIVHAAEVLANDATTPTATPSPSPPPPPPPPPPSPIDLDSSSAREPEVRHDRMNSFERNRRRHRHVFGSSTPPSFSSSLPQLSLIRLATNNNNIKNVCNLSLSSISPPPVNNQNERRIDAPQSKARRRRFQLSREVVRRVDAAGLDGGHHPRGRTAPLQDVCDRVSLTPSSFPLTTSHPSKMDLALSLSITSPCSGLSTDSSTHSDLALMGGQLPQPPPPPCLYSPPSPGDAATTHVALLSTYDADDHEGQEGGGPEGRGGEDGQRLIDCNSRRPRKRSAGGIWRCSKSQELQPKTWQENISGYKMRRKSIHSMVKSHEFF